MYGLQMTNDPVGLKHILCIIRWMV